MFERAAKTMLAVAASQLGSCDASVAFPRDHDRGIWYPFRLVTGATHASQLPVVRPHISLDGRGHEGNYGGLHLLRAPLCLNFRGKY
jgi:hypothetical protein